MSTPTHAAGAAGAPGAAGAAATGAQADGRSTRWEQHRATRRRELVEAAVRAIRLHGAMVGMDDIAAVAGTSKTVVYRHFTDRQGLYAAVCESVDALILRDLGRALGAAGGDLTTVESSPRELIAAAIDSYLALVERDPEVYRFVVNAPILDSPADGDPASAVTSHIAATLATVLRSGLLEAGRDPRPAGVWAAGLVGMVRAAADQWLAGGDTQRATRSQLTDDLTDLAWSGLSSAWVPATGGSP